MNPLSSTSSSSSSLSYLGRESTKIFYGEQNIIEQILLFVSKAEEKIDICLDSRGLSLAVAVESIKNERLKAKTRDIKQRFVIDITKDNVSDCKELIKLGYGEIRHLDGIRGNFEVSDNTKEYMATASFLQEARSDIHLVYSNVKEIIEQQQCVFETVWELFQLISDTRIRRRSNT